MNLVERVKGILLAGKHGEFERAMDDNLRNFTGLLSASPAVIYSFKASGNFAPTFVSTNIETLFGYAPCEYLDNPNFWRERVHPQDLPHVEAEMDVLFKAGKHVVEYRFRKKDGSYCWVNDEQHLMLDAKGAPSEVVGSWSDISARRANSSTSSLPARPVSARRRWIRSSMLAVALGSSALVG